MSGGSPGGEKVIGRAHPGVRHLRLVATADQVATTGPVTSLDQGSVDVADELEDAPNPARWLADPTRRNEMRFWDGTAWSERVSNGGYYATDPVRRPT